MKFVIATGGTGGHLFPALRVSKELERRGHEILYLGSFAQSWDRMQNSGYVFEEVGSKGFTAKSILDKVVAVFAMIKAVGTSSRMLKKIKPDAVVGFGGYGAFPVILAALFLKIPAMIHEQNVMPGAANALLAKCVRKIAISFPESQKYFPFKKTVLTGCPCHLPKPDTDKNAALKAFGLQEGKITLLVFGGSQGSRRINDVFVNAAETLKDMLDFQVIHLCGRAGYEKLQDRYNQLGIPFALFEFLDKMKEAYHVSDLVIARAGAVTVSEVAAFQRPAIFIPYPHAREHQTMNASVLCDGGKVRLLKERDLSVSGLAETVLAVLVHRDRDAGQRGFGYPNAVEKLVEEAVCLAEQR